MREKIFVFPTFCFIIILVLEFMILSQNLVYFPMVNVGIDHSFHMARLHFLREYGYQKNVPNWYGGFDVCLYYSPGFSFFSLPFYILSNNILLTTFFSTLVIYLAFLAVIIAFRKKIGFSKITSLTFFSFLVANPFSIWIFLESGRLAEMFAWLIFLPVFFLMVYYYNRDLEPDFILFIPFFSLLAISHVAVFTASLFVVVPFILIKWNRKVTLYFLISLIIASPWWISFALNYNSGSLQTSENFYGLMLTGFSHINAQNSGILLPFISLVFFYFYYRRDKDSKKLVLFLPSLLFLVSSSFRLVMFIPVIKQIQVGTYYIFSIILALFFFFKMDLPDKGFFKRVFEVSFQLIPLISILILFTYVHQGSINRSYLPVNSEIISLFSEIDDSFLILGTGVYNRSISLAGMPYFDYPLYVYSSVFHNLTTPSGWFPQAPPETLLAKIKETNDLMLSEDCSGFSENLDELNVNYVISYYSGCDNLENCQLTALRNLSSSCLYRV